jgi:hypothetical protein
VDLGLETVHPAADNLAVAGEDADVAGGDHQVTRGGCANNASVLEELARGQVSNTLAD